MNAEIKKQWVADLRAHPELQGREALHQAGFFCCLGRLCELHRLAFIGKWEGPPHKPRKIYLGRNGVLPDEVCKWAGLTENDPKIEGIRLTQHNDGAFEIPRKSFAEIADLIEKHLHEHPID